MKNLVLLVFVASLIGIKGHPARPETDVYDDCPDGSGDCSPPPPPTGAPSPPPPTSGSSNCGVRPSSGARIVGGNEAVKNSIPWQAMLRTDASQFCGGSLIHTRWVLTAAHCVEGESVGGFKIWLGAHGKESKEDTTQEITVEKIIVHPKYNPSNMQNDVALIKLSQDAVLGPGIGLVCLGDDSHHLPLDDITNQCLISGWGTLQSGGQQPDKLQEARVPLVSPSKCEKSYGSMHESMLCAGLEEGGIDSCQGDSGGPLACEYNGRYYLEGATSWGQGCAHKGFYGVYAKVRNLREFINQNMRA